MRLRTSTSDRTRTRRRRGPALLVLAGVLAAAAACNSGGGDEVLSPSTTLPPPYHYVAIGDSYSAGEGAPPYDATPEACRRAERSWPRRLAVDSAGIASIQHRACSGARIEHLVSGWGSRGLQAQIPQEPDLETTLVSVTIGGNDIGFGEIVGACFVYRCPKPDSRDFQDRLAALRTALQDELYPALRAGFPNAHIVHVGYPRLTPPVGTPPHRCLWLSAGDQVAAAGIVDGLNDVVYEVADANDATYVDVSDAYEGHELCTNESWVNDVTIAGGPGAAHPTAAGQRAIERRVATAIGLRLQPEPSRA